MADDIAKRLVGAGEHAWHDMLFGPDMTLREEVSVVVAAVLRELADNPGCDLIALAADIESELPSE